MDGPKDPIGVAVGGNTGHDTRKVENIGGFGGRGGVVLAVREGKGPDGIPHEAPVNIAVKITRGGESRESRHRGGVELLHDGVRLSCSPLKAAHVVAVQKENIAPLIPAGQKMGMGGASDGIRQEHDAYRAHLVIRKIYGSLVGG